MVGESQVTGIIAHELDNHAFLYSNGHMLDLGVLGTNGSRFSAAGAINNHGQVVGDSTTTANDSFFIHPFLWAAGHMMDLGTLGGIQNGSANGINDQGIVVGGSPIRTGELHAFIYDGVLHDLGIGSGSSASSINTFNQVVGTVSGTATRIFLWRNGHARLLPTLGGTNSYFGPAINDFGIIAGTSDLSGDAVQHAFVYAYGRMFDLGPNPAISSFASGLNRFAQVVGGFYMPNVGPEHAFLWRAGSRMLDLNDLIDPQTGWVLTVGTAINDLGQIAGNGIHNGLQRAFLLNPCY